MQALVGRFKYAVLFLCGVCMCAVHAAGEQDDSAAPPRLEDIRVAPGDYKQGYERADYATDSLSLPSRRGVAMDLAANAARLHEGLPVLSAISARLPDADAIALGRRLFFDRRLSRNKTMSCAMCHIPEQGFTNNELKRPVGFEGRGVRRNAPTLLNVVYNTRLFWDGREFDLAQQVWAPLLAPNEMNNPSVGYVIEQIKEDPTYIAMFAQSFDSPPNMLNIGEALAQYQQTLIAADSRFDRWYFGGEQTAITEQEKAGFALFTGKAGCSRCHSVGEADALFTDQLLHNTGVGYADSMRKPTPRVTVQLAPGIQVNVARDYVRSVGLPKFNDLGRYEVTLDPQDRWKFRTPSLRNVALTAPYMHNGEFLSLKEVIRFYNQGGAPNPLLSPLLEPLQLTVDEQKALRRFLDTLTGGNVAALVSDAFDAPVGDTDHLSTSP